MLIYMLTLRGKKNTNRDIRGHASANTNAHPVIDDGSATNTESNNTGANMDANRCILTSGRCLVPP